MLRASLRPTPGEGRVVLWHGATLTTSDGAEVRLQPRTPLKVLEEKKGDCRVSVSGEISAEGTVDCSRLGSLSLRPAEVRTKVDGPVVLTVNGGVLLAPRQRVGDWVEVAGEALGSNFKGWMKAQDLGSTTERSWIAPGLPRFPWVCEDGGWVYDRPAPKNTFLIWIPDPWCRVKILEEQKGWVQVEYLDSSVRVAGWVEADSVKPDRDPRFHPGARSTRIKVKAPLYGKALSKTPFGSIEAGLRVWASVTLRGRTLVQTQGTSIDMVGWVDSGSLE
jgi:hypothetical protein